MSDVKADEVFVNFGFTSGIVETSENC